MNGAAIMAAFSAVVGGIIIADILTHPKGSQAAGNAAATVLKPTYNALLGQAS